MSPLDHLVYGVPDLASGVQRFAELTGVSPAPGGRHLDRGTANYLVRLSDSAYLEILGPDPEAAAPPSWFGLDQLVAPRLLTWAIRPTDLEACLIAARAAGFDPGEAKSMSRRTSDGQLLQWRLTRDTVGAGGVVPFLIDWGATTHPTDNPLPQLTLVTLTLSTPDPDQLAEQLAALDLGGVSEVAIESAAEPSLRVLLDGPTGPITLR